VGTAGLSISWRRVHTRVQRLHCKLHAVHRVAHVLRVIVET